MPSSHTFAVIDELREGRSDDRLFQLDPPDDAPSEWKPLRLRAIRTKGPEGIESFFLTSLPRSSFSRTQLRELYHMRWEAEEFYKYRMDGTGYWWHVAVARTIETANIFKFNSFWEDRRWESTW